MDYAHLITVEPGKRSGQPCVRGMRITVRDVLEYLAGGMTTDELLADFPELTPEDIRACLAYAAAGRPREPTVRSKLVPPAAGPAGGRFPRQRPYVRSWPTRRPVCWSCRGGRRERRSEMRHALSALALLSLAGCADGPPPKPADPPPPEAGASVVTLVGPQEPGDRLTFSGRVLDYQGQPLAKAAVVVYHADRDGLYNPKDANTRVPRLRGVAVTDADGRFRVATVRPGAYPDRSEPAHLHVGVMAPAHHPLDLAYWFEGDPLITEPVRRKAAKDPRTVIVKLTRQPDGAWAFRHDIRLEST
jgi:protocatechuate 3,4-dioxygenase beta subunit/uncharacterized protein (DUF433 family)